MRQSFNRASATVISAGGVFCVRFPNTDSKDRSDFIVREAAEEVLHGTSSLGRAVVAPLALRFLGGSHGGILGGALIRDKLDRDDRRVAVDRIHREPPS